MKGFTIAIVDDNVLTGIGLQRILEDIIPMAEVRIFTSFDQLLFLQDHIPEEEGSLVHFFVSSRIYFEHTQFFRSHSQRSIVLVSGDMQITGVLTLNVCQSEQHLIRAILALHHMGHPTRHNAHPSAEGVHPSAHPHHPAPSPAASQSLLTAREVEVARLLSKGLINKEVAEELSISLTTAISHRKNIMEKLHARSLADIIIYSVMNGLIDLGEL